MLVTFPDKIARQKGASRNSVDVLPNDINELKKTINTNALAAPAPIGDVFISSDTTEPTTYLLPVDYTTIVIEAGSQINILSVELHADAAPNTIIRIVAPAIGANVSAGAGGTINGGGTTLSISAGHVVTLIKIAATNTWIGSSVAQSTLVSG